MTNIIHEVESKYNKQNMLHDLQRRKQGPKLVQQL